MRRNWKAYDEENEKNVAGDGEIIIGAMIDMIETPAPHLHAAGASIGIVTVHLEGELTPTFRLGEGDRAGKKIGAAARRDLCRDRPLGPDHRHTRLHL